MRVPRITVRRAVLVVMAGALLSGLAIRDRMLGHQVEPGAASQSIDPPRPPKLPEGIRANVIEAPKSPITPPVRPERIVRSSVKQTEPEGAPLENDEASRIKRLRSQKEDGEEGTLKLEAVELLRPEGEKRYLAGDGGAVCHEVFQDGKFKGYMNSWFSRGIIDQIAQGTDGPETLYSAFPFPIPDLYFEVTETASGALLGKVTNLYSADGRDFLDRIVWQDGVEQYFVTIQDLVYEADSQGRRLNPNPVWRKEIRMEDANDQHLRSEDWVMIDDESVRITVGSHMDAYRIFARLRSSCEPDAEMFPETVEITPENFPQFVRRVFLEDGEQ